MWWKIPKLAFNKKFQTPAFTISETNFLKSTCVCVYVHNTEEIQLSLTYFKKLIVKE